MYAELNESTNLYNLMELDVRDVSVIEVGLSSIHMNTPEKAHANFLMERIDEELSEYTPHKK